MATLAMDTQVTDAGDRSYLTGQFKHDSAVDRYLNGLSLLHVKCRISAVTMVSSEQGGEFSLCLDATEAEKPGVCWYAFSREISWP